MEYQNTEVLVVGAGPVGLTTACELLKHGIPCRIIDKREKPNTFSKAFAVHSRTLEVFKHMGLEKAFLKAGKKIDKAHFYSNGNKFLTTDFSKLEELYPFLIALPQNRVEAILEDHLNALGGVVERGLSLEDLEVNEDYTVAKLKHNDNQKETVVAKFLVAADGNRSKVRDLTNIPSKTVKYKNAFIVVDAKVTWDGLQESADTFLTNKGYLMLTPFPEDDYYRVVIGDKVSKEREKLTLADVNAIKDSYGFDAIKIHDPIWISKTNVQKRLINAYSVNQVFFAGDAAHINSPVGGQGMNLGIQDAHNLAWKIAYVSKGFLGKNCLKSYNEERKKVAERVLKATHIMNNALTTTNSVKIGIRNAVYSKVSNHKKLAVKLAEKGAGLDYNYKHSSLNYNNSQDRKLFEKTGLKVGERVSEKHIAKLSTLLPDVNMYMAFTVIQFSKDENTANAFKHSFTFFNANTTYFNTIILTPEDAKQLGRSYNTLEHYFGITTNAICIIRPDGFLWARYTPQTEADFLEFAIHLQQHKTQTLINA